MGPKVRDFTDRERQLRVVVDADPIYESLLGLFALQSDTTLDEYESCSPFVEQYEAHADAALKADLDALGCCGELWLWLIGMAHDLPTPRTMDQLASALEAMDPIELRTTLLHNAGFRSGRGFDDDVVAAAASGDDAAIAAIFADEHHDAAIEDLMRGGPTDTGTLIASLLRRFHEAVGSHVESVRPILERDAASTRSMARTMSPAHLVEKATNGITFEMQPDMSGILLIPSIVIRPWVVISEHDTLRVFCYSVADELLGGDLDAPPTYMVEMFKALGDERRLRILGILAEGDSGLREIAERVDLAKSTAHHHLRVLRSAGLVRVIVGDDKRYSLRRDTVPEASRLLDGYLGRQGTHTREDTA